MATYLHQSIRSITRNICLAGILLIYTLPLSAQDLDVPYVPTPNEVVEKMLDLAEVQSDDYVIDLGSGDGRIVIAAAKRGASGHGIDLDPKRIAEARKNATMAEVDDKVMFKQQDIFETDFREASVITMYLLPSVNKKLRPRLLDELRPGTRLVSHSFDMGDWEPDQEVTLSSESSNRTHSIFYWVVPAKVDGSWQWSAENTTFNMNIDQKYQEIIVSLKDENGTSYDIQDKKLEGERITFQALNGNERFVYSGRISGDNIEGTMQHHSTNDKTVSDWSATRQ
ncbi:class I SAM-dependent methyltransferase [Fodinibius sediminis]|uniref:Methyltransferase domain-containing protein n=1 Tax=Fodinibius sediminis TaxID=1214077 RepID=A0A521B578_9BACT|nr:class I SAM-dependent methyltransferase [Fodinibius sediminis]SMO42213.1 Methyltransferase domain-containing protein [Fodinibius sediminis]